MMMHLIISAYLHHLGGLSLVEQAERHRLSARLRLPCSRSRTDAATFQHEGILHLASPLKIDRHSLSIEAV